MAQHMDCLCCADTKSMRIPKIYHFGNLSAVPEGKLVLELYPVPVLELHPVCTDPSSAELSS